ncbi:hypothetical protein MANES_01G192950v8 [Manihot esculenta]|uniref:Uncharacterized protein n=1 Tax=Manihot esculenta TaxID=3983 RepID=A0ACB7IGA9_MANES|nr:hypothetical protein MANES_01G192950v8 [Manihot esculenta]
MLCSLLFAANSCSCCFVVIAGDLFSQFPIGQMCSFTQFRAQLKSILCKFPVTWRPSCSISCTIFGEKILVYFVFLTFKFVAFGFYGFSSIEFYIAHFP